MNTQIEIKQADAEIAELKTKLEIAQKRRDTLASADHAVYASKVMTSKQSNDNPTPSKSKNNYTH